MDIEDPGKLSIRKRLRFLAKDSMLYGGAAAVNKAFALITFPLLARHFSVGDYGLIDLFSVAASFLAILFIFGQDSAVARYFYEYKGEEQRKQLISQSLIFQILCILVILPAFWMLSSSFASRFHASSEAPLLLKIILLQVPFLVLNNFSLNLLKWTFSRAKFLFVSLGSAIVNTLLLLIAVFLFDIGVAGFFIVGLTVQIIFAALGILFVRQWLVWPNHIRYLREMLLFALPYGVTGCAAAFVAVMERSLVNTMLGSQELGLYAAGTKVAMLIMIMIYAFQTAWGPFSLAIHKEVDAAQTYSLVLKGFALFMCVSVLLLSTFGQVIINILASDRYAGAAIVVFPLAMGLAVQGVGWITEIGISLSKKSYLSLYSYGMFVLVTGVSIYFLASALGLVGVALGVMLGHFTQATVATLLAQRAYPLAWPFVQILVLLFVSLCLGSIGVWLSTIYGAALSMLYLFVGIGVVLLVGWMHTLSGSERARIKAILLSLRPSSRTRTQ